MKIEGSVALVTGTHHALGAAMVRALLARGAAKVYAATRGANFAAQPGALPVTLDMTRPTQVQALARQLDDVTLLVNNIVHFEVDPGLPAGAHDGAPGLHRTPAGRSLQLIDAFAPVLAANGGGAVVNVLSVLSSQAPSDQGDSHGAVRTMGRVLGAPRAGLLPGSPQEPRRGPFVAPGVKELGSGPSFLESAPRAGPLPGPPPMGVKELGSGPSFLESDGLRPRLAAQNTELLFFRTALIDAGSDDRLQGQRTRADDLARHVLDALCAHRAAASSRQQPSGDAT